jgi:hypothetical protein
MCRRTRTTNEAQRAGHEGFQLAKHTAEWLAGFVCSGDPRAVNNVHADTADT